MAYGVRVEDQLRQSLMLQYIKDNWLKYNTFLEEFSKNTPQTESQLRMLLLDCFLFLIIFKQREEVSS